MGLGHIRRLVAVVAALFVLTAGCGNQTTTGSPGEGTDGALLGGGTWVLTDGTVAGQPLTVPDGNRITLTVDGNQASGTAACNQYTAH